MTDFKVADSYDKKNYSESFSKASMISGSNLKIWNSEIIKNEKEIGKRWMNDTTTSSSSINNSTLSLHIAAYENFVESATNAHHQKRSLNEKKQVRKRKNGKQVFTAASTSLVQNPFEFPRQQNDQPATPEVMQFKSTQQLVNPNQTNASNQQAQTSEAVKISATWNDLSKVDTDLQLAADRLEINKFRQLKITVCGSKEYVSVQLAADDKSHVPILSSSKPSSPTKQAPTTTNVKTAEIGTQTDPWEIDQKHERVLVSSFAFAPYSLKTGKQIKCIQVDFVKISQ